MSKILDEVLAANKAYTADFGAKGGLPMPPGRHFAILTCMDARLDPAKYAGLAEGDAHVIRNAGGRASDDAIRSLVISYKLLGTREWFVIHHTDCGNGIYNQDRIFMVTDDLGYLLDRMHRCRTGLAGLNIDRLDGRIFFQSRPYGFGLYGFFRKTMPIGPTQGFFLEVILLSVPSLMDAAISGLLDASS